MLAILWMEMVWLGASAPILQMIEFIAGFAMSVGTCLMAAALVSLDD